ncbi:hypothetical protein Tco_1522125, partial [Tanacetum coccineum]
ACGPVDQALPVERYMNDLLQYVSATMNNDRSGIAVSSCADYVDPEVNTFKLHNGNSTVFML